MKTRYEIQGMTCGHCVLSVKKTLAAVPGIQAVTQVTLGTAEVEGEASDADVVRALREQGYEAKVQT